MQGRARGRKGERKTYHINPYYHITMEFGGYLLNVAKKPTRSRARKGEAQGVLSYQKATGIFDILCPWVHAFSSTREKTRKHFVPLQNSEHGVSISSGFWSIL